MKKIDFVHELNPVYDIIIALKRIANHDSFENNYFEAAGYQSNPRIQQMLSEMEQKMPRFFKQEMQLFFDDELSFFSILWRLILRKDIKNFDSLIETLIHLDNDDFRKCMLESCVVKEIFGGDEEKTKEVTALLSDRDAFFQKVKQVKRFSPDDEEKIYEVYDYPQDSKERFVKLLERFYEIYAEYLPEIHENTKKTNEKSKKMCAKSPQKFVSEFLKMKSSFICKDARVELSPSFFAEILIYIPINDDTHCILVYGTDIEKKRSLEQKTQERKQLFKIFAEEKRAEMIKKLANHSYYGNEMAQELNLTSATASYHLSMLQGIGIVELQKEGNKIYYSLNKEVLKDLFSKAYEDLTS